MKKNLRIIIGLFFFVFFASFPLWARFIVYNPIIIPQDGHQMDWLMFGVQSFSAIASFGMIFYTALSLRQNREQIEDQQQRWEIEHKPEIVASMVTHEGYLYICVKNASIVPVRNIRMSLTHMPPKEKVSFYKTFVEGIEHAVFSIEPGGRRYIHMYEPASNTKLEDEYLGLKFTFDNNIEYCVDVPFKVATFIEDDLNEKKLKMDINNISTALQQIERKR